jgi:hypothetical protein
MRSRKGCHHSIVIQGHGGLGFKVHLIVIQGHGGADFKGSNIEFGDPRGKMLQHISRNFGYQNWVLLGAGEAHSRLLRNETPGADDGVVRVGVVLEEEVLGLQKLMVSGVGFRVRASRCCIFVFWWTCHHRLVRKIRVPAVGFEGLEHICPLEQAKTPDSHINQCWVSSVWGL